MKLIDMWSLTQALIFVSSALLITVVWVKVSGIYKYRGKNYYVFGLNLFPLVSWTLGLVLMRILYDAIDHPYKFIIICFCYWLILPSLEYVGYHCFGMRLTCDYPGLWKSDLMHAPAYSKAYYLLIGPAYLLMTNGLIIELVKMGLLTGA
ncbi:MAG: hypothetical protein V1866_00900 [archaeon]